MNMHATVDGTRAAEPKPAFDSPFSCVSAMEDHLNEIDEYISLIDCVADSIASKNEFRHSGALSRIADCLKRVNKDLSIVHDFLFREHHPRRQHLERNGWPGDKKEGDADRPE